MTEQEYKQCRAKEQSLYFWGHLVGGLCSFLNAALIGAAFTLLILDNHTYALTILLLNMLAIAILILGNMGSRELKKRWEFYFDKCGEFLCERLKERLENERED